MNPVNDFPNDKSWHPLDFQFFTFEEGVSNEGLKKLVLKIIHFFYLVLHVQTENQIIYKRSISRDYFNELILKASVSCSEMN